MWVREINAKQLGTEPKPLRSEHKAIVHTCFYSIQ